MRNLIIIISLVFVLNLSATIINVPSDQPTIQAGIDATLDADTVLVQPGTYIENINYNGKNITVASLFLTTQDSTYIAETIIDGNQNDTVVRIESNEDSTAVLCGFTITNGYGSNHGGGVYLNNSSPELKDLRILNNSSNDGGGIYINHASPNIENTLISENTGTGEGGGGISCYYDNYNGQSSFINNVTISNNIADLYGGGILFSHSSANLENVVIKNNYVGNNDYALGGGISMRNGSPHLKNVLIESNICNAPYSKEGGGIYCESASPVLENVTITGNTASTGSGIHCQWEAFPSLVNCLLWNNTNQEIYLSPYGDSSSITISFSDIQGGLEGINTNGGQIYWLDGNIDSDPLFIDPVNGDFHLTENSPCIDAGDPDSPLDPDGTIADMGTFYFEQVGVIFPPDANFEADSTSGFFPFTVNFTDLSTPGTGTIDGWFWDFDNDGTIDSYDQNPSYTYSDSGLYSVSLTVTDTNNTTSTETKFDYINVYSGSVWHISTTGSNSTGTGSEEYPFATIQHGINIAVDYDTVLVHPGTYFENINYTGKLITVASQYLTTQDTTYISQTIIDGSQPVNADSASVVTFESEEDSTAVLIGFTIKNGSGTFDTYWDENCGGGILCNNSSPSIENVTISNNSAVRGGGIYCIDNSSPGLENVTIIGNSADNGGGGIFCYSNSSPSLVNVTIIGNSADNGGGGIYCFYHCNPRLENVIITGNNVSQESGGGIYCFGNSSPSLINVTISDNSAVNGGGGIFCYSNSNPSLVNVTIIGNSAEYGGGGIYCFYNSSPSLVNVTISGNSAVNGSGGGIFCYSNSNPSLVNVTITGNSADHDGGGVYCTSNSDTELLNCILWNNTPQEIYLREYYDPCSITISYSDIQGGEAGIVTNNNGIANWLEGNINENPLFVDPLLGDFHLTENSPCIDAGDPVFPLDPDNTICDMGAYYFHQDQHIIVEEIYPEPDSLTISQGDSINFYIHAIDPDGNPIDYSWELDNEIVSIDNIYTFNTDENTSGEYEITLFVTDNFDSRNELNFLWNITVSDVDQNIIVNDIQPSPGPVTINEMEIIDFFFSGSDPDGNPLEFSWELDGVEVSTDSTFTFETNYTSVGEYLVIFEVTDNFGIRRISGCESRNTLIYTWDVTVNDVDQNIIINDIQPYTGPVIIDEMEIIDFFFSGFDPDSNPLEFSWKLDGVEVSTDSTYTFETNYTSAGEYLVTLDVTDNFGIRRKSGISRNTLNYSWDVTVNDLSGNGGVLIPVITKLYHNHPNPFNPVTCIQFDIKENETGSLTLYNIKGQKIKSQQFESGRHKYSWNASNQTSGIYLYKLKAGNYEHTKKMLLLK